MSVRYELLFSVYSAPPFITEILMVLLVIVILGFPCTSYLSRYVPKNFVLPSETAPEVGVAETVPESNEPVTDERETDAGNDEPGPEPDRDLLESGSDDSVPGDSDSDDSSPDDSSPDDSSPDDSGSDDSSPENTGPNGPGPAEPSPEEPSPDDPSLEEPSPEEPSPEEPRHEDTGGYKSSEGDDIQDSVDKEVVVEVHADRESVKQNNQENNLSGVSRTQGRSVQVLYSKINNYPDLSHSETEAYHEKFTPLAKHKYFTAENSVMDKMSLEADFHSFLRDIPGDCITPRNEIQRGERGRLNRQQTRNISSCSAAGEVLTLHNLNAEKSCFLSDMSGLEPYELQDNSFNSVSSSPLFSNKYKRKMTDCMQLKCKGIKHRENQRYAGRNVSHESRPFLPCTEDLMTDESVKGFLMKDSSRYKQYELRTCKEETASSPLFNNNYNSKLDGSLKMKLESMYQSSNMGYTESNASQKIQQLIPCTEHSVTDNLEKDFFVKSQSHTSKFQDWCHTKDVDDFNNSLSMNENAFFKTLSFTPTEGGDMDQEKYNCYNKASKGRCCFESKESQDDYKGRNETADWVQTNCNGQNTCYRSAEDKLRYYLEDRRYRLTKEDSNNDKDPIYSHSERFQHSENRAGIGKFKSSSDVNDAESTLSDKLHKIKFQEAQLFLLLLKDMHHKNVRRKNKWQLERNLNYYPHYSSDERATHYPPGKANYQNLGDNNGKSVSETMNISELMSFLTSKSKEKCFSSTDEEFDVHNM